MTTPVYTLSLAFSRTPIMTCFGLEGLLYNVPTLEPSVYAILDRRGREIGTATRYRAGDWLVELESGVKAGPGFILV